MTITAVGETSLEPFVTPAVGEPLGTLIGVGTVTGDASAGRQELRWTLGAFVYVFRMLSVRMVAGAGGLVNLRFSTGYIAGGAGEDYIDSFDLPADATGRAGHTFIPASIFCVPRDTDVVIIITTPNQNTIVMNCAFRALVFPENVLQVADPALLARFII